jgi:hypothetical protein
LISSIKITLTTTIKKLCTKKKKKKERKRPFKQNKKKLAKEKALFLSKRTDKLESITTVNSGIQRKASH